MTKFQKKLWIGIAILAALTPVGLLLPEKFDAGDAWGEWGTDKLKDMLGYVPRGLERLSELWKAPLPDYALGDGGSPAMQYVVYILSGVIGIVLAALIFLIIKKTLLRHLKNE